jgi:hypothetical protein
MKLFRLALIGCCLSASVAVAEKVPYLLEAPTAEGVPFLGPVPPAPVSPKGYPGERTDCGPIRFSLCEWVAPNPAAPFTGACEDNYFAGQPCPDPVFPDVHTIRSDCELLHSGHDDQWCRGAHVYQCCPREQTPSGSNSDPAAVH